MNYFLQFSLLDLPKKFNIFLTHVKFHNLNIFNIYHHFLIPCILRLCFVFIFFLSLCGVFCLLPVTPSKWCWLKSNERFQVYYVCLGSERVWMFVMLCLMMVTAAFHFSVFLTLFSTIQCCLPACLPLFVCSLEFSQTFNYQPFWFTTLMHCCLCVCIYVWGSVKTQWCVVVIIVITTIVVVVVVHRHSQTPPTNHSSIHPTIQSLVVEGKLMEYTVHLLLFLGCWFFLAFHTTDPLLNLTFFFSDICLLSGRATL